MKQSKKNAFTLIELVAVLVIMAIIALIVTPLVMSIIRKARISADKRSIDAYGRSIELAIAGYLMDTGSFPTSIDQLTIEYSGEEVVCSTTNINSDSSVYLADCTVGGRSVEGYTYGSDKSPSYTSYTVGDQITYNNVDYYVIKDSGVKDSTVILLKAEPLTVDEVNQYGAGHVNAHAINSIGTAYNKNGYGGMQYYSSPTCVQYGESSGCKTDYATSEVKYVVDSWSFANVLNGLHEARLLTYVEYEQFIEKRQICTENCYEDNVLMYDWLSSNDYDYWLETSYNDSMYDLWTVGAFGGNRRCSINEVVVRPVIVLDKSVL